MDVLTHAQDCLTRKLLLLPTAAVAFRPVTQAAPTPFWLSVPTVFPQTEGPTPRSGRLEALDSQPAHHLPPVVSVQPEGGDAGIGPGGWKGSSRASGLL